MIGPRPSIYELIMTGEQRLLERAEREQQNLAIEQRRIDAAKADALEAIVKGADIAADLREIGREAFARGKLTRHNLRRYWGEDERAQYDQIIRLVVESPELSPQDRRAIAATKQSVLLSGENPRAFVPDYNFQNMSGQLGALIGFSIGVYAPYTIESIAHLGELATAVSGSIGALIGGVSTEVIRAGVTGMRNPIPQPFESVASLIEQRVASIEDKMGYTRVSSKSA